jgi:nucleoside-diphosphate-sugar epimerase
MTTLLTGINGFLGMSLATDLSGRGVDVIGIDVASGETETPWQVETLDVRDRDALRTLMGDRGVDSVIHCGGISGPHVANEQPALVTEVNVLGTTNIFEVAREVGMAGRIVLMSSSSTYGEAAELKSIETPCPETQVLLASEPYGSSKVASESMMRAYVEQAGIDAVALRVSIVYGPGRQTYCGITEMILQALGPGTIELHHGSDLPLPWIYVDDVVAAVSAALAAPREKLVNHGTHAFNVTGPGYPTFSEIAATIAELVPGTAVEQSDEPDKYAMNARKMSLEASAQGLGWVPQVAINSGVARLVDHVRGQKPGT